MILCKGTPELVREASEACFELLAKAGEPAVAGAPQFGMGRDTGEAEREFWPH